MKLSVFFITLLITTYTLAQDGKFNFGSRSSGMAGASVTHEDQYSLFNNIGGLAKVEDHKFFAGYQNRYGISEFQVIGAGIIYASDIGNAGIGFFKFGDDLFSQQRLHLAIGNKFQQVSLGVGVDLLQYQVATVGTRQTIAIQFGGIAEIIPQLHFGAHIFNINQAKLVDKTREKVPTIMKAGISYRSDSELIINLEVEKDLEFNEVIKTGIEYQIVEGVFIRTGISTQPLLSAFGVGFHPKNLQFDYSYLGNAKLGAVHEISFSFSQKK